jgi:hypothetical protein
MARLKGITITLYDLTQTGTDPLNKPIYAETPVQVDNVLVAPVESTEQLETYTLTGRRAVYQLGIPKGDTHDWTAGKRVSFFGADWRIIGIPTEGIESMIPLDWNKKVQVERYEQG